MALYTGWNCLFFDFIPFLWFNRIGFFVRFRQILGCTKAKAFPDNSSNKGRVNNLNELLVNQFFQPVPDGRFRDTDGFRNFRNGGRTPSDLKSSNIRRNLFMDDDIPFFDSLKENFSFFFIKYLAGEYPCPFDLAT